VLNAAYLGVMLNKTVALICVLIFLPFSAVGGNGPEEVRKLLVGRWNADQVYPDGIRVVMDVEYFANGTCETDIRYFGARGQTISYQLTERWRIEGERILFKVVTANDPKLIGGESSVEILEATEAAFVLKSPSTGFVTTLRRCNAT